MWSEGLDLRYVHSHLYSELSTCNQITQDRCLVCVSPLNLFPTVHTTVPGLFVDNPSPLKVLGVLEEERGILGVSWCPSRSPEEDLGSLWGPVVLGEMCEVYEWALRADGRPLGGLFGPWGVSRDHGGGIWLCVCLSVTESSATPPAEKINPH